jgi:hypothetical protein
LHQLLQQKPEEAHVEETTTSATVANYIVVEDRSTNTTTSSSVVVDNQREDDSSSSSSSIDLLPEAKRQRRTMIEGVSSPPDSSNNILQAAALVAVDDDAAAPAPSSSPSSSVNQQQNDFAEPKSDHNLTSGDMDEKAELELKEDKDPTMGADLVPVYFDTSLVYNQSRIEAMIELHTFIGSAYLSSQKDDNSVKDNNTITNVEYQGDNIFGCFDNSGNHVIRSSGGGDHQRRLFGPVYTVRKYKPLTDVEMVYAVIIWMDAAVKDKVEVEITSYEDYFQLLDLT